MNTNSMPDAPRAAAEAIVGQHIRCPPPTPEESQQRWAARHQAMELSLAMLMMGLRQKIGPDGDLQATFRDWYDRSQALKWDTAKLAS